MIKGVEIRYRSNARSFTGRLRPDGIIVITVPPGVDPDCADKIIRELVEKIHAKAPSEWRPRFSEGQEISAGSRKITIQRRTLRQGYVCASTAGNDITINVPHGLVMGTQSVDLLINKVILNCAKVIAPPELFPRAQEIAEKLGFRNIRWEMGRGHRTLGTCHRDGHIALSAINVFLPPELRDYIVYHELAHLTEMNHSARFHALCNEYAGGRERILEKMLKEFQWPIIR